MRPLSRLRRALITIPSSQDWCEAALAVAVLAVVIGPLGLASDLLAFQPRPWKEIGSLAVIAFFVPALGEEMLFRGFLPDRAEAARPFLPVLGWVVAFVGWHVVETIWLPSAEPIFLRPDFLAAAALLGLICASLRVRSGSLWTAVAVHWFAVVAWQGWLGGPTFLALA